jgi:hypothetical protein
LPPRECRENGTSVPKAVLILYFFAGA